MEDNTTLRLTCLARIHQCFDRPAWLFHRTLMPMATVHRPFRACSRGALSTPRLPTGRRFGLLTTLPAERPFHLWQVVPTIVDECNREDDPDEIHRGKPSFASNLAAFKLTVSPCIPRGISDYSIELPMVRPAGWCDLLPKQFHERRGIARGMGVNVIIEIYVNIPALGREIPDSIGEFA